MLRMKWKGATIVDAFKCCNIVQATSKIGVALPRILDQFLGSELSFYFDPGCA